MRAGNAIDLKLTITPGPGKGMRIQLPDRITQIEQHDLVISPWDPEGFDEHPELWGVTEPPVPTQR